MNPNLTSRRTFLKGVGVSLALPMLDSLGNVLYASDVAAEPRRLLLVSLPLGIYREAFIPSESGKNYQTPEYLDLIKDFRDQFTIISGLDHPGVSGGHTTQSRIFTGQPSNELNRRSLDQYVASKIGKFTRYDSLTLSAGAHDFSWTDSGSMVPPVPSLSEAYAKLFVSDGAANKEQVLHEIGRGKSIMDFMLGEAKAIRPHLSKTDQDKLEEYFESVRSAEQQLVKAEDWVHKPKPQISSGPLTDPEDRNAIIEQMRGVADMTYLAFKTDSTRVITFGYFRQGSVTVPGVEAGYHALSHHGKEAHAIEQLKTVEAAFFQELNRLMTNLRNTQEGNETLLDRTTIIVTSNLGNGSNHSNRDLPVLLAGGRYQHGQHLAFEKSTVPLSNLYVSVLNQFGIPDSSFATSTGPLQGLQIL